MDFGDGDSTLACHCLEQGDPTRVRQMLDVRVVLNRDAEKAHGPLDEMLAISRNLGWLEACVKGLPCVRHHCGVRAGASNDQAMQ